MSQQSLPNRQIWLELRVWIDEREAWERAHGQSALTPGQLKIISGLTASNKEPDFDQTQNYISELHELTQRRRYAAPDFSRDEGVTSQTGSERWRVFCRLPWCGETFPQPGYGLAAGEAAPAFQVKKVARQFAAKHALDFIRDHPDHQQRKNVSTFLNSPIVPPAPKRVKTGVQDEPEVGSAPAGHTIWTDSSKDPKADSVTLPLVPLVKVPSLDEDVAVLALRLNIRTPVYHIEPEKTDERFFCGSANWPREPGAPKEEIRVEGIFGKEQAKEQLAAKVFKWLQKQFDQREAELEAILGEAALKS